MQSRSVTQGCLHTLVPQTKGSQAALEAVAQLPPPSQKAAFFSVPAVHDAEAHMVEDGAFAQVWLAAQAPVLPQMPFGVHELCGSGLPVPTKEQVPSPFTLQAWQRGQLALPQQTLSTQLAVAHCSSVEHPAPNPPPFMQEWEAASQKLPVAQSPLVEQLVWQPAVVHP